jgi:hypothetical protein
LKKIKRDLLCAAMLFTGESIVGTIEFQGFETKDLFIIGKPFAFLEMGGVYRTLPVIKGKTAGTNVNGSHLR